MPPTPTPLPSEPQSPAERIFVEYLTGLEAGAQPDLEELCSRHPHEAAALRQIFSDWLRVQEFLARAGWAATPSQPALPAGAPEPRAPGVERESTWRFSAEVLQRLAGRSVASGRYRVQAEVARGGMGQVLRVWDEDLRRSLAMKVILGREDPGGERATPFVSARALARFLEEAQVNAQLDHPGIVPVHELGVDGEGRVYFTMKLVEGRTLADIYEELGRGDGAWTQTRVLGLIQKVCDAMAYAHAKGVIHRDLKPLNVMVGRFGEVYVMDWGLAKVVERKDDFEGDAQMAGLDTDRTAWSAQDEASLSLSETGSGLGTPGYMAPEQRLGKWNEVGPHSDVYSVGAMLARLLTGRRPESESRPVSEDAPNAPSELAAICDKAMARDWRARYRDMSDLSEDLAAYIEGRVVRAHRTGPWIEARKWVQRNRALAASLAAALLAVLVGLGAYSVESQRRRDQQQASRAEGYLQSAERSALRGDWKQSIDQLARARAEGYADEVRLLVREAEAWTGLSDRKRCNEALDRIDSLGGAGELAGKVALLRGDLAMSEWRGAGAAASQLQRARELGVGPADTAYVEGLLAEKSEEALASFDQALALDPFHHGAHAAKAMLEVLLGRAEAARSSALTMAAIFPDDPAPPTVEAVLLASQYRFDEADNVCRGIAAKHGSKTALFSEVCVEAYRALAELGPETWYGGGSAFSPLLFFSLMPKINEMASGGGVAELGSAGPNLPSLRQGFGAVLPALLAPNPSREQVEGLEQAFEHHPDGFIEYIRATTLINLPEEGEVTKLGKMRWSAEAFGRAGRTPSFVTGMQRAARYWRIRCLDFVAVNAPEPALYESLRPELEYFLDVEPRSLIEDSFLTEIALRAGTYDLARVFASSWRQLAKAGDNGPLRSLARIDVSDGRPAAALELLDGLLLDAPDDQEMIGLREQALSALRGSLEHYGG